MFHKRYTPVSAFYHNRPVMTGVTFVGAFDRESHKYLVDDGSERFSGGQDLPGRDWWYGSISYPTVYFGKPYCWGGFDQFAQDPGWWFPYGFSDFDWWLAPLGTHDHSGYCPDRHISSIVTADLVY